MRKKTLIISTIVAVVLVVASAIMWNMLSFPEIRQKYEINIARNVDSQEEEHALAAAESLNYSEVTSLERFIGSSDSEDYLNPGTYLEYTYANFIDQEALDYYQARYDGLNGKGYPRVIEYTYNANVSEYTNFRIYNSPAPEGVAWHNTTMVTVKSTANGSSVSTSSAMQIYARNQTGYQLTGWDYDFNYTDCIVVEMDLEYSEVYAPLAAFFSNVRQTVVMDRDFSPMLIGIKMFAAIS